MHALGLDLIEAGSVVQRRIMSRLTRHRPHQIMLAHLSSACRHINAVYLSPE
jgi:hypothetical protein